MNKPVKFLLEMANCARPNVHARYLIGSDGKAKYVPEHRPIGLIGDQGSPSFGSAHRHILSGGKANETGRI